MSNPQCSRRMRGRTHREDRNWESCSCTSECLTCPSLSLWEHPVSTGPLISLNDSSALGGGGRNYINTRVSKSYLSDMSDSLTIFSTFWFLLTAFFISAFSSSVIHIIYLFRYCLHTLLGLTFPVHLKLSLFPSSAPSLIITPPNAPQALPSPHPLPSLEHEVPSDEYPERELQNAKFQLPPLEPVFMISSQGFPDD